MNIHNCGQAKKPRAAAACPLEIVPHEIKSNCYSNLRLLAGFLAFWLAECMQIFALAAKN